MLLARLTILTQSATQSVTMMQCFERIQAISSPLARRVGLYSVLMVLMLSSCEGVGFRNVDEYRNRASLESAKAVMLQVSGGLRAYYSSRGSYPLTTEASLYDSIRNYMPRPLDPTFLYRNDDGQGYYIAVGGRNNRLIYSFPPTIGSDDFTLYWAGPNGLNEEGDGDDVLASEAETTRRIERRRQMDLRGDGSRFQLRLVRTGNNLFKDSAVFTIRENDSSLFRDAWPLQAYFIHRPELTPSQRAQLVRDELERFFQPSQFVHTDSLTQHDWRRWVELEPNSLEALEIMKRNETMFNYYVGAEGSRGVAWSPIRKKFIRVWKSF